MEEIRIPQFEVDGSHVAYPDAAHAKKRGSCYNPAIRPIHENMNIGKNDRSCSEQDICGAVAALPL